MKKQCGNCYWYEGGQSGVCYYLPPVAVPIMAQSPLQRPGSGGNVPAAFSVRPPTDASARCHHWSSNGLESSN
jgi:hypothetical protein